MENYHKHIFVLFTIALAIVLTGIFFEEEMGGKRKIQDLELIVIKNDSNKWFYEIYKDTRLLIRQEYIPAVNGVQYFKSKQDAEKIGKLMIEKLCSGENPSISIKELQAYDIDFKK